MNIDELNEYLKENDRCPKCKGFNTERHPVVYDDGEVSEDTDECQCFDCGWKWLLV